MPIEFVLNGTRCRVEPRSDERFLETLRERCGITSLKDGCSPQGQCGCCVALVDGLPKTTCAMPARVADERKQIANCFAATAGLQCGFCIPGIALHASAHVALGTDGYPSDPGAECAALVEDASRLGDDGEAAARRPQAGHALLAERFGGMAPTSRAATDLNLDAIRAEASVEALRLWSRMADL